MRKFIYLILILFLSLTSFGQSLQEGIRAIKLGHTLRAAARYVEAEESFKRGLYAAQNAGDKYWEGAAYEGLGLLNHDKENEEEAIIYLNKALVIYTKLGAEASKEAVAFLLKSWDKLSVPQYYGGIDVGSKGVKATAITVRLNSNSEYTYEVKYENTKNTEPMALTPQSNEETAKAIKLFLDTLINVHNVPIEKIYIVISSGLRQAMDMPANAGKEAELRKIIGTSINNPSKKIDILTPAQEAEYLTIGIVPPHLRLTSSIMDIGSGNTKGGYFVNDKDFEPISFGTATKSFAKTIKGVKPPPKDIKEFYEQGLWFIENGKAKELNDELSRKPGTKNRKRVYLVGGIVWAMNAYMHPEKIKELEDNIFVEINLKDAELFQKAAIRNYDSLIHPSLAHIADEKALDLAKTTLEKVRTTFDQESIIAGSLWLNAMMKEYCNSSTPKRFYFPKYGVIGWLSGYIVKQISEENRRKTD